MNTQEPMGLPRGTVRAVLAVVIVGAFVAACFFGVVKEALVAMASLAGTVITHYFKMREDGK